MFILNVNLRKIVPNSGVGAGPPDFRIIGITSISAANILNMIICDAICILEISVPDIYVSIYLLKTKSILVVRTIFAIIKTDTRSYIFFFYLKTSLNNYFI